MKKNWNRKNSEYNAWRHARRRCEDPRDRKYPDYGGRGISMCEEWRNSFDAFLAHIGPKPSLGLSLDRIDNNRGYEPGNVRWATYQEQNKNRRRTGGWRRTHCRRGHLLDESNIYRWGRQRTCRQCALKKMAAYHLRKSMAA